MPIIASWLVICGLTVDEYVALLEQQRESDGLEVWAASLAFRQPINIIFGDTVWSISVEGFDYSHPSLFATAVLFEEILNEDNLSQLGAAAPPPVADSSAPRPGWSGHPITLIPEYPAQLDSDHMDTDPDKLLTAEAIVHPPILHAGQAIPWTCSVCDMSLPSGMALYRHMRLVHLHDKPYSCNNCGSMYNNLKELSSHHSNIYCVAMVSYVKCDYASV